MKALVQRVSHASVVVEKNTIAEINQGILLLLGVEKNDDAQCVSKTLDKVMHTRIFEDADGKMNLSLLDINAELLVVSQFTLAADTSSGRRPGFSTAAPPDQAKLLYQQFVELAIQQGIGTQTGEFGADMKVSLCNDGPCTFLFEVTH